MPLLGSLKIWVLHGAVVMHNDSTAKETTDVRSKAISTHTQN